MQDKFSVSGDQLVGRGLTFDISVLSSAKGRADHLAEIGEMIYLQGRASALLSQDDCFDLQFAVEALRGLAVIVGPGLASERYCHAFAALARLLHEQTGAA